MTSLSAPAVNAAIIQRLGALAADTQPRWGKLNAAQMLAHCQKPLRVAAGEMKLKRGLIGLLFGRLAKKKFVTGDAPFGQNLPTDPKFLAPEADDFARERAALVELVRRYGETGAVTREPHPFFGPLSSAEWDRLMWKHLDHHLRQFGA